MDTKCNLTPSNVINACPADLLPCPFCGGKAELVIVLGSDPIEMWSPVKWSVRCLRCYCKQYPHISDHDAVEEWNRRVSPPPQCDTQKPMTVEYKGYTAKIIGTTEDGALVYHGTVMGMTDLVTFEGETQEEAVQSFHDAIDDYIDTCKDIGKKPLQDYIDTLPDPNTLKEKAIKAISDLADYYGELKRRVKGNA